MAVIECIPNVSEGRRLSLVESLADSIRQVTDVRLLDYSADAAHNRSVFTFTGDVAAVTQAAVALMRRAVAGIDMTQHTGEHPRIGAVDVIPFVPLDGATMADCVAVARSVGRSIADQCGVPVLLYEEAASRPQRQRLEDVRRGQFEGLTAKLATPEWTPDFGPSQPHPTAGAVAVGARGPLIAYNINLATDQIEVARDIAGVIRQSGGGLPYVKAMGVRLHNRGIVQVSINLTNYEETPIFQVFEAVREEAARRGVSVLESEIVGLIPSAALTAAAAHYLQIARFSNRQVLEHRLREAG